MLIRRQEFEDARTLLARVLERNPRNADALILDGRLALDKGDGDSAIANFNTVLQDKPGSPEVLRLLARAYSKNNRPHLAVDVLKRAAQIDPDNVGIRLELAQLMISAGQSADASEQFREILEARPNHAGALEQLIKVQIQEQDWDMAAESANRAKELHADAAWPYYYAGIVSSAQRSYQSSIEDLKIAFSRAPKDPKVFLALVQSHIGVGQEDQAMAMLKARLVTNPNDLASRITLGEILAQQGKEQEAETEFQTAIKLNPGLELPYRLLARHRWAWGNIAESLWVYEQGVAATGGSAGFLMELGVAYDRAGKPERAIEMFEKAIEKNEKSEAAANNLALLLATYRQDSTSLDRAKGLAEGLRIHENASFMDTLGWVYLRRNELDAALPLLERALSSKPDSPEIHYHLGAAYQAKGDVELARAHLEQAVSSNIPFPGIEDAKARLGTLGGR